MEPVPELQWRIGPYDVELIRLGLFAMDGGTIFGIIPKSLWLRTYPHCDDGNLVRLACYAMLIRGNGITLVADGGIGDKVHEKVRQHYAVDQQEGALPKALAARGIGVEDVTHFVYTHLHFDHAGGATEAGPDGRVRPVFPKAKYYVQAAQLSWANNPSDKDKASYLPENWESVVDGGQMRELEGDTALAPGIDLRVVHGHTAGMMAILIRDGADGLFWGVDLFPTAANLPPHYVPAADNHPLASLEEKRVCLEECHGNGWILAPGHDPYTPPGLVNRDDRGRWGLAVDGVR